LITIVHKFILVTRAPVDLRAGELRLRALGSPGGRITSLQFAGVEWLAEPVRAYRPVAAEERDWGRCDASGWDECFPNVGAGPVPWEADHGDVWRRPTDWEVGPAGTSARGVTDVRAPSRAYRFTREITLTPSGVVVDYEVRNDGEAPLSWAWAQHAMLAADDGATLVLPHDVGVRVESVFGTGSAGVELEEVLRTGRMGPRLDLSGTTGRAAKLWLESPVPPWIAVIRRGLWLGWDLRASSVPHVGLWLNRGGWDAAGRRLDHVGVEPAFGCSDDPATATSAGLAPIAPGETAAWRTVLRFGHGTELIMHNLDNVS
jgi:hypothetical protein